MSKKLIIAGGGIGGMAAAVSLHRAGFAVRVFERAPAFAEVGAGISLWPNATRVLRSLGVLDDIVALADPVTHFDLLWPDGALISSIAMAGYAAPSLCVHRADLHRALRRSLPEACLEANQTLSAFADSGAGIAAKFASGLEAEADGLIGADGINSTIRAQLHGAAAPLYRGYQIWRAIAPAPPGLARGHISETWGAGRRFGIMPIGQGRVCWYATHNESRWGELSPIRPLGSEQSDHAAQIREIQELFAGWHSPIAELIASTDPAAILRNDACDRNPLDCWGRGRVTLLGDAAHPITPNVGQGACMAIEDGACLAKSLLAAPDVAAAFRGYEVSRKSRTAFVARQARRIGMIGQWENAWIANARNFAAGLVISHMPKSRFKAVYGYEV